MSQAIREMHLFITATATGAQTCLQAGRAAAFTLVTRGKRLTVPFLHNYGGRVEQPQLRGELPVQRSFFTGRTHHFVSFIINSKTPSPPQECKNKRERNHFTSQFKTADFPLTQSLNWLESLLTCEPTRQPKLALIKGMVQLCFLPNLKF